ncbi:MAG: ATP-binding protein [Acidimicrobiales bacterium]
MNRIRLGLRSRVTMAFAVGGLMVTILLTVITLTIARQVLLSDRDDVAEVVVFSNAARVQRQLTGDLDPQAVQGVVDSLNTRAGSRVLLITNDGEGQFARDESSFSVVDVPADLQAITVDGEAGRMRTSVQDEPMIVYGIPIQGFEDVVYYEAVPLGEIEDTLVTLQFVLLGGALIVAAVAALAGRFAAGGALRPLVEVSEAAEAIAGGRLDTRLDPQGDEDLASLAASFNEMAGGLEERIQRDARFASEVSHELRSPLMTLTASVEVLENARDEMTPRMQTALDLLSSDIARFQTLVEDLLEISRFDVGTAALQADAMLYAEFVRAAVDAATHVEVDVQVDESVENVIVEADKRRLARVVANLIDNAAKYGAGATRVHLSRTDHTVSMAVEDAGPGVPLEERFVIFDRFSRGGAGGRRGYDTGVGLGLSLVAEHVNLHGGRVWVEDRPDGASGARFVVELPIAEIFEEELV